MTISERLLVAFGPAVAAVLLAGCAATSVGGVAQPAGAGPVPPVSTAPRSSSQPSSTRSLPPTTGPVIFSCGTEDLPVGTTGSEPVPTPTGLPVLTITQGSNSWIANSLTEPYAIAVYADGTAIRAEADGAYADPLPAMTIGRIDRCVVTGVIADLVELAGDDLGDPFVTDQGSTTIEISAAAAGGADLRLSAYALGVGDEYVEPAQSAARKRLGGAIASLLGGLADGRPWTAESLRVSSLGAPQGNLADRPPALRWPLESAMPATSADTDGAAVCAELAGQQAAAVLAVLAGRPSATMWTDGQQNQVLAIGVLLPGQPACPAG
ncbi:MAG: hypothetical protein ABJD68_05660 [Nakamurella sp.]